MKPINIRKKNAKFIINALLLVLFLNLTSYSKTEANTKGDFVSETAASGEWSDPANWSTATAPDPSSDKCDLTFYHDIDYNPSTSPWTDPFIWDNNISIYITSGVTVTINADITIKNNFTITIEPGGQLIINGSMSIQNNVDGSIDGSVYISGDLTVDGGGHSDISGIGEIVVDGTITDDNNVIAPNLINNIDRWLIVDNGNWDVASSWSASSKGPAASSIPNKQCIVHIDTAYTGYLNIDAAIKALDIKLGGKLIINPTQTLTVDSTVTNNGELEMNSDASGTGSFIYNGTTSVSATCKRYVTSNEYHYVSSPMTAAPVSSYNVTSGGNPNPNFYYYDETETNTDWMYGWKQASSGNLELGKGYALYTDENYAYKLQGGNLQNTDFDVAITNTSSAGGSKSWNLIGNPFPCNLDADIFITDNESSSVFTGSLYFWDDDGTSGIGYASDDYIVYTKGGGTSGGNGGIFDGTITPLQGFFVQANTGGNLTFKTSSKTKTGGTFVKSASKNSKDIGDMKMLHLSLSNENGLYNDILVKFAEDADDDIDIYDGLKLRGNPNIAFFTMLNNEEYAIQGFPVDFRVKVVNLAWDVNVSGEYTIKAEDFINTDNMKIVLLDKQTGETVNLKEHDYTFETFGNVTDRITLIFNNLEQSDSGNDQIDLENKPDLTYSDKRFFVNNIKEPSVIKIYDLSGKLISQKNLSEGSDYFNLDANAATGYYIIKITDNKNSYSYKVFTN